MTGIDSWSTTAATNATADGGSINWAEGQAPSTVNNTARQMAADIRSAFNSLIWFQYGTGDQGSGNLAVPAVYASATSFTITGADVTTIYHANRRVRAVGSTTGTIYGTISSSSYNGGNTTTTVNVTWDSGSLSNETLVVSLSQAPQVGRPVHMAGVQGFMPIPQGRVTLTSATPVTTSDVTAATSVYYSPYIGNLVPISDGTVLVPTAFSELTLALDSTNTDTGYHQSGKNFDLFVVNDSGTIRLGTGPAWSSDTSRGTGAGTTELQRVNGVWTNKVSMTLRFGSATGNTITVSANQGTYVGSFRATANGQTEDSATARLVWNCYNRRPRRLEKAFGNTSWTYTTATYRQANGDSSNRVTVLAGLLEDTVDCTVMGAARNSNGSSVGVYVAIGVDSTSSIHRADLLAGTCGASSSSLGTPWAKYNDYPGLGYHALNALEASDASGTTTWYGDTSSGSVVLATTGISGVCFA